jgi:hypothetical protein
MSSLWWILPIIVWVVGFMCSAHIARKQIDQYDVMPAIAALFVFAGCVATGLGIMLGHFL